MPAIKESLKHQCLHTTFVTCSRSAWAKNSRSDFGLGFQLQTYPLEYRNLLRDIFPLNVETMTLKTVLAFT